MENYDLRSGME